MAIELPVSLYASHPNTSFNLQHYLTPPGPPLAKMWAEAQEATNKLYESPHFQKELRRLEEQYKQARLESFHTGPHPIILNPVLDGYHGPTWHRDHGLPSPPGTPELPEEEYQIRS